MTTSFTFKLEKSFKEVIEQKAKERQLSVAAYLRTLVLEDSKK